MNKKYMLIAGVVLAALIGIFWISRPNRKISATGGILDFVPVVRTDLSEKVDATGKVRAAISLDLYPGYSACVKKLLVKAGDKAREGDLLMVLNSPAMRDQWVEAESNLKQAELNLALAKNELERLQALLTIQGASAQEVENARNKAAINEEQVKIARFKLDGMKAYADYRFLDTNREDIQIRAPFTGEVGWINIRNGASVTPETLLGTFLKGNVLEIEAEVDESEIGIVKPGQRVSIVYSSEESAGVVAEVGSTGMETSGVVVFPIRVKVVRNNGGLKPGMSVDINIIVQKRENVLAMPAAALMERNGGTMAAVKRGDKTVFVPVKIGARSGVMVEVLSGLKEGDRVGVRTPETSPQQNGEHRGRGPGMIRFRR
ncbi:MAG: efflux RND transporter periplasmic adaptor subunit [Bacillota bacterium]